MSRRSPGGYRAADRIVRRRRQRDLLISLLLGVVLLLVLLLGLYLLASAESLLAALEGTLP